MTKDQLRNMLMTAAMVLTGLSTFWVWGPLTWVKPLLQNVSALLTGIASNDPLLTQIVALFGSGQISLPHPVKALTHHEVAMLEKPTNQHLNAVVDAAPTSMA